MLGARTEGTLLKVRNGLISEGNSGYTEDLIKDRGPCVCLIPHLFHLRRGRKSTWIKKCVWVSKWQSVTLDCQFI